MVDDELALIPTRFHIFRSENADVDELLVFCPTVADVNALRANRILELQDGSLIMFTSAPATPAQESPKLSYISMPVPLIGSMTLSAAEESNEATEPLCERNIYTSQSIKSEGHSACQGHFSPDRYSNTHTEHCSQSTSTGATATNTSLSPALALHTLEAFSYAAQDEKASYQGASDDDGTQAGYGRESTVSETLILESYVIANHFKSLLRWAIETDSKSLSESSEFPFIHSGARSGEKHGLVLRQTTGGSSLSWGRGSDTDTFGAVEEKEDERVFPYAVLLMIDTRLKTYSVTIQAPDAAEVRERIRACVELIISLEKMSYRITLTGADPVSFIP